MFDAAPARAEDLAVIETMRDEAARWLRSKGSDQWQEPWPTAEDQAARIAASIAAGETWMVRHGDTIAATIALDDDVHPQLWTPDERQEPATYIHRMVVRRAYAGQGLGAELLDWAADRAARAGDGWLRADVWTSNEDLQHYYVARGFKHVRTVELHGYPSGAVFQRPARRIATPRIRESVV